MRVESATAQEWAANGGLLCINLCAKPSPKPSRAPWLADRGALDVLQGPRAVRPRPPSVVSGPPHI